MSLAIGSRLHRTRDLAGFFYHQRVRGFDVPEEPFFDPASTGPFLEMLAKADLYLEFGSGGSTVVAARRGVRTITVESDKYFARAVKRKIGPQAPNTMLVIDTGVTVEWSYPLIRRPTPGRVRRWAAYIERPLELIARTPGVFPDLILVDGRFRRACALACAARAMETGASTTICFDDYVDREWYHDVEAYLGTPEMVGRMARFRIASGGVPIPDAVIRDAVSDPR